MRDMAVVNERSVWQLLGCRYGIEGATLGYFGGSWLHFGSRFGYWRALVAEGWDLKL